MRNKENRGLAFSLNRGLALAKNDLIARMDSDDMCRERSISKADRLHAKESRNCSLQVLGKRSVNRVTQEDFRRTPMHFRDIVKYAKFRSPMNHPTVVFRKSVIEKIGGYPLLDRAQDCFMDQIIKQGCLFHNLEEYLVTMRVAMTSPSKASHN